MIQSYQVYVDKKVSFWVIFLLNLYDFYCMQSANAQYDDIYVIKANERCCKVEAKNIELQIMIDIRVSLSSIVTEF